MRESVVNPILVLNIEYYVCRDNSFEYSDTLCGWYVNM
jgi:hypothetical protein